MLKRTAADERPTTCRLGKLSWHLRLMQVLWNYGTVTTLMFMWLKLELIPFLFEEDYPNTGTCEFSTAYVPQWMYAGWASHSCRGLSRWRMHLWFLLLTYYQHLELFPPKSRLLLFTWSSPVKMVTPTAALQALERISWLSPKPYSKNPAKIKEAEMAVKKFYARNRASMENRGVEEMQIR